MTLNKTLARWLEAHGATREEAEAAADPARAITLDMDVYRTLLKRGLSEEEAERWAVTALMLRLPALFHALVSTTCPVELAHKAAEEVADYVDQGRRPVTWAVGRMAGKR
jgi:hypothetical protein